MNGDYLHLHGAFANTAVGSYKLHPFKIHSTCTVGILHSYTTGSTDTLKHVGIPTGTRELRGRMYYYGLVPVENPFIGFGSFSIHLHCDDRYGLRNSQYECYSP